MNPIFHIGRHDLRLMVRDRVFFFWTLLFPLFFIFVFGTLFKADREPAKVSLTVQNLDSGPWGEYFISQVRSPGLALSVTRETPKEYLRWLVIPADFSRRIEMRQTQTLSLMNKAGGNLEAGAQAEVRIVQSIARVITEIALFGEGDLRGFFAHRPEFRDLVEIRSGFPAGTLTVVPSGFDHVIPGVIVQFIMMMVLIYGGISVMVDRKRGALARILSGPVSRGQLFLGKFLGRLLMGLVQALILLAVGKILFHLNLGNAFLSMSIVVLFAAAMAAFSIFLGSLLGKEDVIVGLAVLLANVFSALGGCWWPIEVVPPGVRLVAMASPAYWAMDAFHQVIFFHHGFSAILPNLAVLAGLTAVLTALAARFFKVRD